LVGTRGTPRLRSAAVGAEGTAPAGAAALSAAEGGREDQ